MSDAEDRIVAREVMIERIIALNERIENVGHGKAGNFLLIAVGAMGPGCLFDEIRTTEEAEDAAKVLMWLENFLKE